MSSSLRSGEHATNGRLKLIVRMTAMSWQFSGACVLVVALHGLLLVSSLALLATAGVGIDILRAAVDGTAPAKDGWQTVLGTSLAEPYRRVAAMAGVVLLLAAVNAAFKYGAAVATTRLAQQIIVQLRTEVYAKLQRLSFRFYDRQDSSTIINRVAGDVLAIRNFIEGVLVKVLTVVLSLAVYFTYMFSLHGPLTIACLATSPFLWTAAVWFSNKTRPWYQRSSELGDALILRLSENIQGQQVIKGFSREADEIARFEAANERLRDQKSEIFQAISRFQPWTGLLTQINMLVLIGYGGWLVIEGALPLGAGLFVFANLLHEFANQVGQITNIANSIQSSLTGAERVFEVLDADDELPIAASPVRIERAKGAIRFENVSFEYEAGKPVLSDVSLEIEPGQCVGFVGETGSGKTTLLSLIPRFHDVSQGRVLVDGIDVRDYDLADLRRNMGLVFQESFLFSNTVAANIAFGRPGAGIAEIQAAAERAAAAEFISGLPEGYANLVGENGLTLSGGQRQRLAIARALLLDPAILILDDATAAVDAGTEQELRRSLVSAQAGRTTLVVSNRVGLLQHCDCIYVLDRGRIVQQGHHRTLLHTPGEYRRLAQLQMVDEFLAPSPEVA